MQFILLCKVTDLGYGKTSEFTLEKLQDLTDREHGAIADHLLIIQKDLSFEDL